MDKTHLPNASLVIFGSTGDLAKRKLFPSIFHLYKKGVLPENFAVIGAAIDDLSEEEFRERVANAITSDVSTQTIRAFCRHFTYTPLDVTKEESFHALHTSLRETEQQYHLPGNRIFYLATAPRFFADIATNLQKSGITDTAKTKQLIVEKPFGKDYQSAQQLNDSLRQAFLEEEIFRIDHYLGKEMVLNIAHLRFTNSLFEGIWNNKYVDNVQITSSESLGVEERGGYYDNTGALRDMVQNHMVQLITLLTMEPPKDQNQEAFRQEKINVLRDFRKLDPNEVSNFFVRGQYSTGEIQNKKVPAYQEEQYVDPNSRTDTFVAGKVLIDNTRWAGVPFYIRTGKRMTTKSTKIVVEFKESPYKLPYEDLPDNNEGVSNLLTIEIRPNFDVTLSINGKKLGLTNEQEQYPLHISKNNQEGAYAYERLLFDCLQRNAAHFAHWEEVALSWKYIDRIAFHWQQDGQGRIPTYPSGSMGPKESSALLEKNGHTWWPISDEQTKKSNLKPKLSYSEQLPFKFKHNQVK